MNMLRNPALHKLSCELGRKKPRLHKISRYLDELWLEYESPKNTSHTAQAARAEISRPSFITSLRSFL